jgi:hypothetical protein
MSSGLLPIAINSETVDSAKTRPFYLYKKKVIIPTGIVAFLLVATLALIRDAPAMTNHQLPETVGAARAQTSLPATEASPVAEAATTSAELIVNGREVALPNNGSVSQTINNPASNSATVQVQVNNQSSGHTSNSGSTTSIQIHSRTSSSAHYSP